MRNQLRGVTQTSSSSSPAFRHSASRTALVALFALGVVFGAGCSSKDNTTAPAPVTGPSFNFTFPTAGQSVQFTFPAAGSFGYRCAAHPSMTGTVVVSTAATTDSALVEVGYSNTNTFNPASVTILPGGRVRWQRQPANITAIHTVTRP